MDDDDDDDVGGAAAAAGNDPDFDLRAWWWDTRKMCRFLSKIVRTEACRYGPSFEGCDFAGISQT